jgi:hypothetical protein
LKTAVEVCILNNLVCMHDIENRWYRIWN